MTRFFITGFAFIYAALLTGPAYAYLDPGTGSMIIQVLIGVIAGALVTLKLFWSKIKALFNGNRPSDKQ